MPRSPRPADAIVEAFLAAFTLITALIWGALDWFLDFPMIANFAAAGIVGLICYIVWDIAHPSVYDRETDQHRREYWKRRVQERHERR